MTTENRLQFHPVAVSLRIGVVAVNSFAHGENLSRAMVTGSKEKE